MFPIRPYPLAGKNVQFISAGRKTTTTTTKKGSLRLWAYRVDRRKGVFEHYLLFMVLTELEASEWDGDGMGFGLISSIITSILKS